MYGLPLPSSGIWQILVPLVYSEGELALLQHIVVGGAEAQVRLGVGAVEERIHLALARVRLLS